MNIKIIMPPTLNFSAAFKLPYGAGVVKNFLESKGHRVHIVDLNILNHRWRAPSCSGKGNRINIKLLQNKKFIEWCLESSRNRHFLKIVERWIYGRQWDDVQLVGFSIQSYGAMLTAIAISRYIREQSSVPIVMGGAYMNLFGEFFFERIDCCDYIIVGDSLFPFAELIEYIDGKRSLDTVANVLYKKNEKPAHTHRRKYPIESIPVADYSGLDLSLYEVPREPAIGPYYGLRLPYEVSRGCPYRCTFCTSCQCYPFEAKSLPKIVSEVKEMTERYRSRLFHFIDSEINTSYVYLENFCDALIKSNLGIKWHSYALPYGMNKKVIHKMKESGCHSLWFGLESACNKTLERLHKPFRIEEAEEIIKWTYEAGIEVRVFFIAGLPYEDTGNIKKTSEFINAHRRNIAQFQIAYFRVEHSSLMYQNPAENGIRILRPHFYDAKKWYYEFDELDGLKWHRKQRQINTTYRALKKLTDNLY